MTCIDAYINVPAFEFIDKINIKCTYYIIIILGV